MKGQLPIVLYEESHYQLINVLGHFSVILQIDICYQVEFTHTSSAGKTARKITKILGSFVFELEFESFKSVEYSWCNEFSKMGTFFWLTRNMKRTRRLLVG